MRLRDYVKKSEDFKRISEIKYYYDKKIFIRGWINIIRKSGKICFLELRDGSGIIQLVVSKDKLGEVDFAKVKSLSKESAIEVYGLVKEGYQSEDYEIEVFKIKIISECQDYRLGKKDHGPEYLFDNRHLYLRDKKVSSIMRIRSCVFKRSREFLYKNGFYEFTSPIITPNACEGTTTLFELDYFDEKAYLSQSGQLYSEAGIYGLEKIFCFGPLFRAEKSKTRRHLTEFWAIEPEMAWYDSIQNMQLQEDFLKYILKGIVRDCDKDLITLGRDVDELISFLETDFEIITYSDIIKQLKNAGFSIKWGEDLGVKEEEYISAKVGKPLFIYLYPVECRAFYIEPDAKDPRLALSNDLLVPGFGEIITGGQRASSYDFLISQIKNHGLVEEHFKWYLDLRKYGSVIHSGFGMGIERLLRWLCDLHHIRETIPFPRNLTKFRP